MIATISKLINMINDDKIVPEMLNNFNKLNVHFYQKSKNNKYLFCNDAIANATGLNINNDLVGQTDFDCVWSKSAKLMTENDKKTIAAAESMLFLESSFIFTNGKAEKTVYVSYKKPLRAASNKIIGITGLSFILNGDELQTTIAANPQPLKNSENDTKTLFYSNLENKYDLSIRQKECLYYLTKGLPLKQIARKLHLSVRTIEHHIESAKIKMNCFSRIDLIEKLLAI